VDREADCSVGDVTGVLDDYKRLLSYSNPDRDNAFVLPKNALNAAGANGWVEDRGQRRGSAGVQHQEGVHPHSQRRGPRRLSGIPAGGDRGLQAAEACPVVCARLGVHAGPDGRGHLRGGQVLSAGGVADLQAAIGPASPPTERGPSRGDADARSVVQRSSSTSPMMTPSGPRT
jgi:hypothetical protein